MTQKNISIVVAVDENLGIGLNNQLLCHLPDDLKMFKNLTKGHSVIMGRNTWFSLPLRPLPHRDNIVISDVDEDEYGGAAKASSIEESVALMHDEKENFIMGGAMIYRQFMPLSNKLYITRIHHTFDADTFFPEIRDDEWELIKSVRNEADERHKYAFSFEIYVRRGF